MERIVIVGYRPKPGKATALRALMGSHMARLRAEGLVTDRESILMESADGTLIEVFGWKSREAIEAAHDNAAVLKMWDEYAAVSDYVPIAAVAEARELFSDFTPVHEPDIMPQSAQKNPRVDAYLGRAKKWREEMEALRTILLEYPLTEELKWGKPCYTFDESNVVILMPLKESCALLFAKGALLKDPEGILFQPTENTQAARQLRLTGVKEIVKMRAVLKAYVREAIEVQKAGLEVTYKKISEFAVPEEFQARLAESPALKIAYHALTPGRQRGYLLHFSAAKQSKTREARIDKCTPQILDGKGLND